MPSAELERMKSMSDCPKCTLHRKDESLLRPYIEDLKHNSLINRGALLYWTGLYKNLEAEEYKKLEQKDD